MENYEMLLLLYAQNEDNQQNNYKFEIAICICAMYLFAH